MTRIAEVSSTRRVMTRIAEVSSTRRVIWDWVCLRSQGAGGYRWFRMQKLRCGWRFIVHFEVAKHNSMSFFASCSDQSTLLLRRAKSLGAITSEMLQKIENFLKKNWEVWKMRYFCYTSPPHGNQVGDLPGVFIILDQDASELAGLSDF